MDGPRHTECLHELIDSVAAIELDAIAVEFNNDTLTYKELNAKAGRLAAHLRTLGAGPDVLVGVCVERSIDLIITLLAVLKSGAAYIPLDPDYPRDRIQTILSDADASIFITQSTLTCADLTADCVKLCLDQALPLNEQDYVCPDGRPEDLAYVIYTSGSTGKPKGVQITHASAVNFLRSMQKEPGLTGRDIVLAATTVAFDISVLEIFLPLITGARIHLIDRATAADGHQLMEHIQRVTLMQATPATWRMLLAAGWQGQEDLRILCGGEAMPRDLAAELTVRCGALWNMYGPTETTVWSSLFRVPSDTAGLPETVPIGTPIANTSLFVLDDEGRELPAGQTGELYIGGAGLARGYLNREDLTAERFIASNHGRIYRTGDLTRWREDGQLEYLGRTDHQVKVRGYRIELGEIEAVLMNHPAVRTAVVVAYEEELGDKRLGAFVVRSDETTQQELRDHLSAVLPEYMVPNTFAFLRDMPLTPNGKIDRMALPGPGRVTWETDGEYCAPVTTQQQRLAALWEDVLGVTRAGMHDHFFQVGGHSLTATRLITRIKEEFGRLLSFQQFFEAPTLASLDRLLSAGGRDAADALPPITAQPRPERCPLSFAQQRLWYLNQLEGTDTSYNMVEALRLTGALDAERLRASLHMIIQRHEILRTVYREEGGIPFQVVQSAPDFELRHVDLRSVRREEQTARINELAVKEAYHHFDLSRDVLLRVTLIKTDREEHVVLFNFQHIISDDWSMVILYEELRAVYAALSQNREPRLPELTHQYADYACWQKTWMTAEKVEQMMTYWREQLRDVPLTLTLPTDFERKGHRRAQGANLRFDIDPELTRRLEEFSSRQGVTLFMTMWTAFALLLACRTRQEDLVIATTTAGRNHREIEPLIGFFINVLPLRVRLQGNPSVTDILQQVRQTALEAFGQQDLPLDKIIEKLHLSRGDLDLLPLSQIAFNFQNGQEVAPEFPDMRSEFVELDTQVAGTELALLIREHEGGLRTTFEYSTVLFRPETVQQLGKQYMSILRAMVNGGQQNLDGIYIASGLAGADTDRAGRDRYFNSYLNQTNLTGNQLLVWLGQKLDLEDPIYNSALAYNITDRIDPDCFQRAFQKLVDRRDSLRTSVIEESGIPRQVVRDQLTYTVIQKDFSGCPDPRAAAHTWLREQTSRAYQLDGCLFMCALLKVAEEHYIWYISQHHIITDGWSQALIYNDMAAFYKEEVGDGTAPEARCISYQDYVRHERELRQSARYAKAKEFWDRELSLDPEPLRFYGQRVQKESSLVQRLSTTLGPELTASVIAAAQAASPGSKSMEAAKFNVFLTLYALFIAHICGRRELRIGIPLHNRRSADFKEVTGLLMQVVPVRITIEEDDCLRSLLKRVSRAVLKAMQHGQYVMRNPDHNPLYDVVLNYHMWKGPAIHRGPVSVDWVHPGHAQESLSIQVHDFEQELEGREKDFHIDFDFHVDVFTPDMQRIALGQFKHLINLYCQDAQRPLKDISLLTDEDKAMLTGGVNATEREGSEGCLQNLIEEQVRRRPDAIAVEDGNTHLTYTELNRRANRLAHYLQQRGAGPERPIGILVERSPQMIVGLLAILKAGSCYVPLDPKSPPERLKGIVDEALRQPGTAPIILTQESLAGQLPDREGAILLDSGATDWDALPETAPAQQAGAGNLAYIIYTSGSTGTPKGVMIEHRAIVNYTRHSVRQYRMTASDKVLQFSSITFDAAGEEIYPVLSAGGTLVLRDEETIRTPAAFIEKCNRHRITVLSMPTTYFHQLTAAAADGPRFGDHLRMILFGGERIFPQEIRRWQQAYPTSPELVNTYGPTEATVVATTYFLPPADSMMDTEREIPIGKPVDNAQVYVFNTHGQPVGVGIPGELCIGGAGLARGYLKRPELTSERFILNPMRPDTGERVYRTGDLVRLLPDGHLEFVGRVDDQVKVRGYRIELGEVESVMKDHPALAECAVLARPGDGTDTRLAAYFTAPNCDGVDDLRIFLKDRLPEYMIPADIYRLESFPVTAQGKIDRRALPDIAAEAVGPAQAYEPPSGPTEEAVARMWQDILGVERVGRNDDFFALGGHSLLATQIISRVQQQCGVDLSLRAMFHEPTVRALAEVIEEDKKRAPAAPAIARISRDKHRVRLTGQGDLMEAKP